MSCENTPEFDIEPEDHFDYDMEAHLKDLMTEDFNESEARWVAAFREKVV